MLSHVLLLLSIAGPGNGLQPWDASSPLQLRERRQVAAGDDFEDYEYGPVGTDGPEILENATALVASHPLITMAMLEQRGSVGAGTPESDTEKLATTGPAGPDAGGQAVETLSTDSATRWRTSQPAHTEAETLNPAPTEAGTSQPAPTEAGTSQPAPTEAGTSQPAPTEAGTSQPAPTEAGTSQPAPTEAGTSQPAPTEAGTSQPAPTEVGTSQPAPTEVGTSHPAPTEAETTQLPRNQFIESLFTKSTAADAPSTEPTAVSTEPAGSTVILSPSVAHKDDDMATSHLPDTGLKKGLAVTSGSTAAPPIPGTSDLIPVKQCLLAILILASLATIFFVCTVVLAVRLSRKNHMYPVRNYSPTEMICISSLLPEGGEGAPVTANGGLPKVQDPKTEPGEDRDGDDLTLRSFLP